MGKFDNILIISDIDGTFLGKKSRIVPENIDAIEYFKAEGGRFTFASGRMDVNMRTAIPMLKELINAPAVLANGSYMYDFTCDAVVDVNYLNGPLAADMSCFIRENYPDIGLRMSTSRGFLTDAMVGLIERDLSRKMITKVFVEPVNTWAENCDDWYKLVVRGPADVLDAIRAELLVRYPGKFEHCKSAPTFYEIQNAGCTKATMIERLRKRIEGEVGHRLKVYCCGDYENDIPMLLAADVAACPENALDTVKNICDLTLCHCDSGFIADLIARL